MLTFGVKIASTLCVGKTLLSFLPTCLVNASVLSPVKCGIPFAGLSGHLSGVRIGLDKALMLSLYYFYFLIVFGDSQGVTWKELLYPVRARNSHGFSLIVILGLGGPIGGSIVKRLTHIV